MAGIAPTFPTPSTNAVVNYDGFDFASNIAYKRFYPVSGEDSVGAFTFLSNKLLDAGAGASANAMYTEVNGATTTKNFDYTFNSPLYVKGTALINYTTRTVAQSVVSIVFTIYHIDTASNATSIGTVTSVTTDDGSITEELRQLAKISITGKKFGAGETLRFTFAITESGSGNSARLYHDPNSRQTLTEDSTNATIRTDMTVDIPFRVNL